MKIILVLLALLISVVIGLGIYINSRQINEEPRFVRCSAMYAEDTHETCFLMMTKVDK